ncbi:hypothetical protein L228DRAFT_279964 [Xylona heveae TC161]|uniref:Nucleolar protein Dnt1-like N-terminal domain-containing protein n=1 Tax=Xylona heveae (strain CBS 132557 / TC161) TaxID=1328760 RepID=A0A165JZ36_XYLHT|nr:hypothetical protein L228DRAFT_279964 [Xylona heveae TC161]KZF26811.1 hypothetical protein L228DRAFT_279964 [Xylona heveae TC161]
MRDLRLSIHILPEQSERRVGNTDGVIKFLEPRCPAELPLEDLWKRICDRHDRLYSARPPLNIKKLQDSHENDLEVKTLTVGDVFDDRDIVRVVQGPSRGSVAPESGLRPRFLARPIAGVKRAHQEYLSRPQSSLRQVEVIDEDERESPPHQLSKRQRLGPRQSDNVSEEIEREIHPDTPVRSREEDSEIGLAATNWQEQDAHSPMHIIEDSQRPRLNGYGTKSESPDDRSLLHSVPPSVPNSVRGTPVARGAYDDAKNKALQDALRARERLAAKSGQYSSPVSAQLIENRRRSSNAGSGTPFARSLRSGANRAEPVATPSANQSHQPRKSSSNAVATTTARRASRNTESPALMRGQRAFSRRDSTAVSPRLSISNGRKGSLRPNFEPVEDLAISSEEDSSDEESAPRSRMPTPSTNKASQPQRSPTAENAASARKASAPIASSVAASPSPQAINLVSRRSLSNGNHGHSLTSVRNSASPSPSARLAEPESRRSPSNEDRSRSESSAENPPANRSPSLGRVNAEPVHVQSYENDEGGQSPMSIRETSPSTRDAARSSRSPARFVSRTPSTDSEMDEVTPPRYLSETRPRNPQFHRESSQASPSPRQRNASPSSEESSEDEIPWKRPSPSSSPSVEPQPQPQPRQESSPTPPRATKTSFQGQGQGQSQSQAHSQPSQSRPPSPSKVRPELPKYPSLSALKLHKPRYEPKDVAMGLWPSSQPQPVSSRFAGSQTSLPRSQSESRLQISGARSAGKPGINGVIGAKDKHHVDNRRNGNADQDDDDEDDDDDDESSNSSSSDDDSEESDSSNDDDQPGQNGSQKLAGRQAGDEDAKKNKARSRYSELMKFKALRGA